LFRAWVNWGDGSYQVVGSHRYKRAGAYRTTTQILA
jgi:hypothetical protein